MGKTKKNIKNVFKRTYKNKLNYIPSIDKDITFLIDINAIKHNIKILKKKTGTDIMPILKADAYGHGLIKMAKILRKLKIKYIGVATLGEAILLRKSGDKGRILAWLYDIDGQELIDAFNMDIPIDVAVFDEKTIPKFISLIPRNKVIKVTVFVDTGINRAGIPYDKSFEAFKLLNESRKIKLEGMMSHLVCSEIKNSPIINEQLRKFRELRKQLEEISIKPPLIHIANTSGCMNYNVSDFTLARCGSGIYGMSGDDKPDKNLKLSTSVKTYIIQIKEINKGEGVGYNWKFIAPNKMKVCVLPIGYADMLPRNAYFKMFVYINGTKRKVLGTISMDQIIVESFDKDKVNDDVYIFGNGVNCPQTIYDIAKISDTIPEEILCHAGYRINRVYVK